MNVNKCLKKLIPVFLIIWCELNWNANLNACELKREVTVTLKDHKENFTNKPKSGFNNPAKDEVGKISKKHLDDVNKVIRQNTKLQKWKSMVSILQWVKTSRNTDF